MGALVDGGFLLARGTVAQHGPDTPARCAVAADHDVFQRRHVGEQADVLEGAGDAGGGHLVRRGDPIFRACRPKTTRRIGAYRPVRTLKKVVLPAPLGPIRP
jgi:hypothetical protein